MLNTINKYVSNYFKIYFKRSGIFDEVILSELHEASIDNNGVDPTTTKVVDTIGMDSVELDKMLFIMDKLREGLDNDSGSTGNK